MRMEEMAEYRHMLMSFRVTELQTLLGFAGRSKSGRKHELLGRALALLKCEGNLRVTTKIRDLYNRRNPRKMPMMVNPIPQRQPSRPGPSNVENAGIPVHPDVRLVGLPFFDHIDDLIKPTSLVSRGLSQQQESYIVFHLTPKQEELIRRSRDHRPNSKNEFTVLVQLRFCLSETSCEQEDNFPSTLFLKVNGKPCNITGYSNNYNHGSNMDPKQSKPINITNLCRLSSTVANHIHISWTQKCGQRHVAVVRLVRVVTSSCLIQKLKNRGYKNPDHSRALIKEKLTHDPDSEVATTSLRISLLCPLGKTRMTLPCRAHTCNHLQCFDAALYLQMNERKTTWICPVCDRKAPLKSLVLDGLFREILDSAPSCNDIVFYEDGSWRPVSDTLEPDSKKAVQAILAGSPFDLSNPKKRAETAPEKAPSEPIVIDLTETDSEDERDSSGREGGDSDDGMDRYLSTPNTFASSPRTHEGSSLIMPPGSLGSSQMPPPMYQDFAPFPPLDFRSIPFDAGMDFPHPFLVDDGPRINPAYLFADPELLGHVPTSSSNVIHVD